MFNEQLKRERPAPFVDLRSDAGFKAVLADRNNKDILIGVLNLNLPPEARVEDIVEYSDREQRRDVVYGKKTVLDLVCVDRRGRTFIVEMQSNPKERFFERCVYYASGLYHLELSDGDEYEGLRPVYVVSFLNFLLRHEDESLWDTDRFISHWRFIENRTGEVADQTISVIFVEVAAFSKEKKLKYEVEKMNERDIRAQRAYAVRVSREEGRVEGLEEAKISIAKKLFEIGTPIDVIISCTGIDKATAAGLAEHSLWLVKGR